MARLVQKYVVSAEGRDKGKLFILTEMAPRSGHRWACRALFAMGQAGATIPEHIAQSGMAGLAVMGLNAFMGGINPDLAEPLMDEMLDCVQINHDPSKPELARSLMVDSDVEEIQTIFSLQKEVFLLHARPFTSGGSPTSELSPSEKKAT